MAYVDQNSRPSATGLASAVIVQLAIGAAAITGLSVTQFVNVEKPSGPTIDFPLDPPPPPKPEKKQREATENPPEVAPPTHVPQPEIILDTNPPIINSTDLIFPPTPPQPKPIPTGTPKPPPAPLPAAKTFDPVAAKPRNDPGHWLSDRDYRPSWARQELTGVAKFRLEISAQGKVDGCRIVGSTGHSELDDATCVLVQKRARFEPARGPNGEPVAGSYTGSVLWQLPD